MNRVFEILTGCGGWRATPDVYSSERGLQFNADGNGRVHYLYGQTIFAIVSLRFQVAEPDLLEVEYLKSPPLQRFAGFRPNRKNRRKSLHCSLVKGAYHFVRSVTGHRFRYSWRLEFSESPYPEGLAYPYGTPTVYYGYVKRLPKTKRAGKKEQ